MELCLQLLLFLPTNNIKSFLKTKCFCRQLRLIPSCFRFTTSFLGEPFPALSLILNPVFSLKMFHMQLGWHAGSLEGFVGLTKRLPVALSPNNNLFQIEVGGRLSPQQWKIPALSWGCLCKDEALKAPEGSPSSDGYQITQRNVIVSPLFHCETLEAFWKFLFHCQVLFDCLWPHGLNYARLCCA